MKASVYRELDALLRKDVIISTNTSTLCVLTLAKVIPNRSAKFIGFHLMNPVPMMKLVEIVRSELTDEDTVHTSVELAHRLGKTPIVCKDSPGFINNRILSQYVNSGIVALEKEMASKEDIDKTMTLGFGFPIGPLALADMIGLDVICSAS
mmetsp:Transcript_45423/g.33199  ORF Transcript_45423/g.33199 Transcript_45423/m.33199 type:complete len:151 (+) Transcript_45423:337-789(+)